MILDRSVYKEMESSLLKRLGNPTKCYDIYYDSEKKYYVHETNIEDIRVESDFSGNYRLKINKRYVCENKYIFDKELADAECRRLNKLHWIEEKKRAEDILSTLKQDFIEREFNAKKTISIAELKLKELEDVSNEE